MKFVAAQSELNSALHTVGRIVPSKATHPILTNVLITADQATSQVQLTGYDSDLGIRITLNASVERSGQITVPAKLLAEIIGKQSSDSAITLIAEGEQAEIKTLSGSYQIPGIDADQYPDLPLQSNSKAITLGSGLIAAGLKATLFACSSEESKQVLTGVNIKRDQEGLHFAATDGHRLSCQFTETDVTSDEFCITVPARSLRELSRAFDDEEVQMYVDKSQLIFCGKNQVLTTRILDGIYPNYRALIPDKFSRHIRANRKQLASALDRVGTIASQYNNVVKLEMADGMVTLSVDAQDVGTATEQMPAEIRGEDLVFALNVRYLLDGLKAIDSEDVVIMLNESTTPIIVRSADDIEVFYLYLVMPVQIR